MNSKKTHKWFTERPSWLQDCAHRLVHKGALTEEDNNELLSLCKSESMGKTIDFSHLTTDDFDFDESTKHIHFEAIANINGINALYSNKPLTFGNQQISIVYGRNGSGKSGYVRLLKHACGSRNPGDLLQNIYASDDIQQSAEFTFIENSETKKVNWTGEPIPEFSGIDIYDTACGLIYVNAENEVAFEPWILRLFSLLTNVCTNLSERIKSEIEENKSSLPSFPSEYSGTKSGKWYTEITENTKKTQVNRNTSWIEEDDKKVLDINKRLIEKEPSERATEFRSQALEIKKLVGLLKGLTQVYDEDSCRKFIKLKKSANSKRIAADKDATELFANIPLSGVGTEFWRSMWEAARKFSDEVVYKNSKFPNVKEDSFCVLCQRELDEDSRKRFISFEDYIKGELQNLADEAEEKVIKASVSLPEILSSEKANLIMEIAKISEKETKDFVTGFINDISERKKKLLDEEEYSKLPSLPNIDVLISLVQIARSYLSKSRSYEKDAIELDRKQLKADKNELLARKWLSQQRDAINDEITLLTTIRELRSALVLTNTTALSRRKSILAKELITDAYIQRFHDELEFLNAHSISVDLIKTRTEVGRVYHQICLKNSNMEVMTSEILSEGEFRIVSLAAFLADTISRGSKTPFIFDDPISSLDHFYEEVTSKRLVNLSKSRQLIIFTHRLSLIGYLIKYAEKIDMEVNISCLSQYNTGQVTELPINLKRPDNAVNALLNEHLPKAKKAVSISDKEYEILAKNLCIDIRILLERIVEKYLINDVVRRFSPEVNTKGKINALAKITEDDCTFIDEYMTKYSRFEHSQPDEAPIPLPQPEAIENDLKAIKIFIDEIRIRNR